MTIKVNRAQKSTLFSTIFSDKKNALDMYNALNDSAYANPEEITITTLKNVLFINRQNDVSYILDGTFNLYEHQSTYNPNMPLRSLFYIKDTLEKMIDKKAIFGSKLVMIPTPKVVIFYNGKKNQPDRQYLKLSDAFANKTIQGDLELSVLMINVNHGHNTELMKKCEPLYGYSLYIAKFREYNKDETITSLEAAEKALDYCIKNNVMAEFFTRRRKELIGNILNFTEEDAQELMDDLKAETEVVKAELEESKAELEESKAELEESKAELERLKAILERNNIEF